MTYSTSVVETVAAPAPVVQSMVAPAPVVMSQTVQVPYAPQTVVSPAPLGPPRDVPCIGTLPAIQMATPLTTTVMTAPVAAPVTYSAPVMETVAAPVTYSA